MRRLRALFAGGGTGGHIYPALALASDMRDMGWESLFLGTDRPAEARIFEKSPFRHIGLRTTFLRKTPAGAFRFALRAAESLAAAQSAIRGWKPDVCVGLGGYGSFPGVVCSALRRIPVALFEPNSVPGRANRMLESAAREIWTWFPSAASGFRRRARVLRTGIPLRADLRGLRRAESQGRPPVILVLGGSQGAKGLNALVTGMLRFLPQELAGTGFIHIAGPGHGAAVSSAYKATGIDARVEEYCHDMAARYAEADAVICRCGAGTLAEITALGIPAVLVPHPASPDRHQHRNAEYLASAGAALVLDELSADPAGAARSIASLLSNQTRLSAMSFKSRALSVSSAHGNILKRMGFLAEKTLGKRAQSTFLSHAKA